MIGDLLLGMARNRGIIGFVTDGLVRDIPGLRGVGLPVFCAGVTANSPARNGPGTVGLPIVIGDALVESGRHPGRRQRRSRRGAARRPQQVLGRLEAVRAAERDLEAKVKDGLEIPDFVRAILASERVKSLD